MILMAPCIIDFKGANASLGPVGEGALDTPGPLNGTLQLALALEWPRLLRSALFCSHEPTAFCPPHGLHGGLRHRSAPASAEHCVSFFLLVVIFEGPNSLATWRHARSSQPTSSLYSKQSCPDHFLLSRASKASPARCITLDARLMALSSHVALASSSSSRRTLSTSRSSALVWSPPGPA
jgi:hypothetical protein